MGRVSEMNKGILVPTIDLSKAKSFVCNYNPSPFKGEFLKSKGCDGVTRLIPDSVAVMLTESLSSFSTHDGHRIYRRVVFECDKCRQKHYLDFDISGLKVELKSIEELMKSE